MSIVMSAKIRDKLLTKHNVKPEEVEQCFANKNGEYILDVRAEHASDTPTYWFIAETHYGRKLKVVFISEHGNIYIRTAFEPSPDTINNYLKHGGRAI
jgi:hypothetical protein